MASEKALPSAFGFRRKRDNIPWVSLIVITCLTLVFVNLGDLGIISSFASSTFLLIFALINLSAWRLRRQISGSSLLPLAGLASSFFAWLALIAYLWKTSIENLIWIGVIYLTVIIAELLICRRCLFRER